MPTKSLPERPNLAQLKLQAKELQHLHHVGALARLLDAYPDLVRARTNLEPPYGYFTAATLLHHVAWNPSREEPLPNIVEVARLLLDRGADVGSKSAGYRMFPRLGILQCASAR